MELLRFKLDFLVVSESTQGILHRRGIMCSSFCLVFSFDRNCMISKAAGSHDWFGIAQRMSVL